MMRMCRSLPNQLSVAFLISLAATQAVQGHSSGNFPTLSNAEIRHFNWPGLKADLFANLTLSLTPCGAAASVGDSRHETWFEGIQQRRILKRPAGRLFGGCAVYFYSAQQHLIVRFRVNPLTPRCSKNLALICVASVVTISAKPGISTNSRLLQITLHTLQLENDSRCPPGTSRDRLGLCRRCRRRSRRRHLSRRHRLRVFQAVSSGAAAAEEAASKIENDRILRKDLKLDSNILIDYGDCWQPNWEATECPVCFVKDSADRLEPVLLRRRRSSDAHSQIADRLNLNGPARVANLKCQDRFSLVATFTCLLEMQQPIQCELISILTASFVTIAYIFMPLYIGYVLSQIFAARLVPFVQFHVYNRAALITSSMRTQALYAPSLWDFEPMLEPENLQVVEQVPKQFDRDRRQMANLLFWDGVK